MKYFPNFHFCGPCCDECYETNSQEESEMSFTEARRIVEDKVEDELDVYELYTFTERMKTKLTRKVSDWFEEGQVVDFRYDGKTLEGEIESINDVTISVITTEKRYRIPKEKFPAMVEFEH